MAAVVGWGRSHTAAAAAGCRSAAAATEGETRGMGSIPHYPISPSPPRHTDVALFLYHDLPSPPSPPE